MVLRRLSILMLAFAIALSSHGDEADTPPAPEAAGKLAHFSSPVRESSGVVASRKHADVFWTHGDSGCGPKLYAFRRDGTVLGVCVVAAQNRDWEDIAIDDEGHLYIADTGNNGRGNRTVVVYRVDEPDPTGWETEPPTEEVEVSERWELSYPGKPFDCESLFVFGDFGYVISKMLDGTPATIYRFSLKPQKETAELEEVGKLDTVMPVTGADISADGKRLVIVTPTGIAVYDLADGVASAGASDPARFWFVQPAMEACCFVADGVLTTSEKGDIYFFPNDRLKRRAQANDDGGKAPASGLGWLLPSLGK